MLRLTSKAASHLLKVRRERGLDERSGARFVGSGGRIRLTFSSAPRLGDRVVKGAELPVYVSSEIADTLDQSIIGTKVHEGRTVLVFRRESESTAASAHAG